MKFMSLVVYPVERQQRLLRQAIRYGPVSLEKADRKVAMC